MEPTTRTYIAFFDLDRTILNVNSGSFLVREAHKSKLMSTGNFLKAIYYSLLYKFHLRNTDSIISGMGGWLKGIAEEKVVEISERIVNKQLIGRIRPEIISEIRFHKGNNAELVILSSAMEEICKPIKDHLGFDTLICTRMKVENGYYTGLPETRFCFENEKRKQLEKYCNSMNYYLKDAYYYGDSIADLPALETVGFPICISPDQKLLKIAKERGWTIKKW
jgi:HAD superfamily hydrolase (TIGR01490 family)